MKNFLFLFICGLTMMAALEAQVIHVPADFPTIQQGIEAANNGDTVLVSDGTYFEQIDFLGKKPLMVASEFLMDGDTSHISNTIINGSQATNPDSLSTVFFKHNEDTTSIICGFTITGGGGTVNTYWDIGFGGGIMCYEAGAKVIHNKIIDNQILNLPTTTVGGAGVGTMLVSGDYWIVLEDNLISNNSAYANTANAFGGGVNITINGILRNNIIENNYCNCEVSVGTSVDGGGLEIYGMLGTPIKVYVKNNTICNNQIVGYDAYGSGIMIYNTVETYICDNNIYNNTLDASNEGDGGGIFGQDNSKLVITNNLIDHDTCNGNGCAGSGIDMFSSLGTSLVEGNMIINNVCNATNVSQGSGIAITHPGPVTRVVNNTFAHNIGVGTQNAYGCVFLWDAFNLEVLVDRNIFYDNESMKAGGFYSRNSNNLKVTNNLFLKNRATAYGGAMMINEYFGKGNADLSENFSIDPTAGNEDQKEDTLHASIANNSFYFNSATTSAGAIYSNVNVHTPILFNSTFYGNTAGIGNDLNYIGNSTITLSYSDFDPANISGTWTGTGNINCDPQFESDSLHLSSESDCIDAGTDSVLVQGIWYKSPEWDIEGDVRPYQNGLPDMGADESPYLGTRIEENASDLKTTIWVGTYPNPANSKLVIEFRIPTDNFVSLKIFSAEGTEIETLVSGKLAKGKHSFNWDASRLNNGLYFIRLETETSQFVSKAMILK
jgi:hypothetical protein